MSVWLFYGPDCLDQAERRIVPPCFETYRWISQEKIKIEQAREFVGATRISIYPGKKGVLLFGYLDYCSGNASDVLLKSLEECPPFYEIFLLASDLGVVAPTIRSRSHLVWCPGELVSDPEPERKEMLKRLFSGLDNNNYPLVVQILTQNKSDVEILVEEILWYLSNHPHDYLLFWSRVRVFLQRTRKSWLGLLNLFLQEMKGRPS